MTTATASSTVHQATATSRARGLAMAGIVSSSVATAVGTFWDLTGNESGNKDELGPWLFCVGIILVLAALAYGLGVRGAAAGNASRRSAVLGVLAAATFIVFWTGAPLVLASASVACALVDRDRLGSFGTGSKVGLAGSALAALSAVVLAVVG